VATGITFLVGLFMLYRLHGRRPDPLVTAWSRFCAKLGRLGVTRHPSEGPVTFSRRAAAARPDLREGIERICELYVRLRYGAEATEAEKKTLLQTVAAFPTRDAAIRGAAAQR
jgi:hypothetical protein